MGPRPAPRTARRSARLCVTKVTEGEWGLEYLHARRNEMKTNIGLLDRIVRIGLVALVAVLFFTGQLSSVAAIILGVLAAVFLVTSIVGVCPLYLPLGISTRRRSG